MDFSRADQYGTTCEPNRSGPKIGCFWHNSLGYIAQSPTQSPLQVIRLEPLPLRVCSLRHKIIELIAIELNHPRMKIYGGKYTTEILNHDYLGWAHDVSFRAIFVTAI